MAAARAEAVLSPAAQQAPPARQIVFPLSASKLREAHITPARVAAALAAATQRRAAYCPGTLSVCLEVLGSDSETALLKKATHVLMAGFPNIVRAYADRSQGEWLVKTVGSNLRKVLALDEVDAQRTYSRHIPDVCRTLGALAARQDAGADRLVGEQPRQDLALAGGGDVGDDAGPGGEAGGLQLAAHAAPAARRGPAGGGEDGRRHRRNGVDLLCRRHAARIGIIHAVDVGEQDQALGAHLGSDQGRQAIIVAHRQFLHGDGVVLIDHRHGAEGEQRVDGGAQVQVALAHREIVMGQQQLRSDDALGGQG
jgi:hypothetical protein